MRCSLDIDSMMAKIIAVYFAPANPQRRELFDSWIAHSSSLSFKSKFDIVIALINDESGLEIELDTKQLSDDFRRVMMFRNAFAHGRLIHHRTPDEFRIHHFHGKPESHVLDEKRFQKIENSARSLFDTFRDLWTELLGQ